MRPIAPRCVRVIIRSDKRFSMSFSNHCRVKMCVCVVCVSLATRCNSPQNPSWHGRPAHETRARCPCHTRRREVLQEPQMQLISKPCSIMANNRMEHNCGTRTARAAFRVACGLRSEDLGVRSFCRLCRHHGSGGDTGIAPRVPPTPPDMRFSASGGWTRRGVTDVPPQSPTE